MNHKIVVVVLLISIALVQQTSAQTWSELLPATLTKPSPREHAVGIYDSPGNRMIIFGGRNGSTNYNDVWSFDLSSMTWSDITPSDTNAPQPRFGHTAVYDAKNRRMIMWSGQKASASFFNDIWAFDLANHTWQELTPDSGSPNKRYGAASVYDNIHHRFVTFAGFTDQGRFNDTQAFDLDSNKWIDLTPAGTKPEIRCLLSAGFDSLRHRMLIYAGQHTGPLDDIWEFDVASNTWTDITPSIKPQGRFFSSCVSTPSSLIVFGGNNGTANMSDTWSFDLNTNSWQELQTDSAPPVRNGHIAIYIPEEQSMVIFGGWGGQMYNDIWKLNGLVTSVKNEFIAPRQLKLFQNFPNPFNPSTTIHFTLGHPQFVSVKIYNILGKELRTLIEKELPQGEHAIHFEPFDFPSGVYFYRLSGEHLTETRSMVFLK